MSTYEKGAIINPLLKDKITLVVAVNEEGYIGKDGDQIWVNSHDRQRFRRLTTGHTVVMGRKTFESMGSKPLPHRVNIVMSSTLDKRTPGVHVARNAAEVAQIYEAHGKNLLFIIGGAEVYRIFYPVASVILLTQAVDKTIGDVKLGFAIEQDKWVVGSVMKMNHKLGEEVKHSHTYITLRRKEEKEEVDETATAVEDEAGD